MKFTEFFWDFDGTLFDTYPRMNRAMQKAAADLGLDISLEELTPLTKVTLGYTAKKLFGDRAAEMMERYRIHAEEEPIDDIRMYDGAAEMLKSVCAHGGRNYLYTHRGTNAHDILRLNGISQLFTDVVTKADGFPVKPAPDALLSQMSKHHLTPDQCVMIGDRDIDLLAGINAGMSGALFDPDGYYYDTFDTPYKYHTMFEMMCDLTWDNERLNLQVSDMLAMQSQLQELHKASWGGVKPELAVRQLLWLEGELGEVIDVVKKNTPQKIAAPGFARTRLIEEMVDVAMYFGDVLLCYGITAEEFSAAYMQKHQHNMHRNYAQEKKDRYGE